MKKSKQCPFETPSDNHRRFKLSVCLEKILGGEVINLSKGCDCSLFLQHLHEPNELKKIIREMLPEAIDVTINGPFEDRIFLIQYPEYLNVFSLNSDLCDNPFIITYAQEIILSTPEKMLSRAQFSPTLLERLKLPKVKLVALYHPENFPLPRFSLGISDIARAVREEYKGQVTLSDMQLDKSVNDIFEEVQNELADIIGISVTFGQQDVLEQLLDLIATIKNYAPLIVIGGSLAALNAKHLVSTYPNLIVGLGDGESIFPDIISYWHGDKPISEISNIMFLSEHNEPIKTARTVLPSITAGIPELDLLASTLSSRGVMQLESTRGCSYACSFCPRAHKGIWSPQSINLFEKILPEIASIFQNHPEISKKIFLVDEEFVGYKVEDETNTRILNVCNTLKNHGFTFETSARVDQVYRRNKDKEWHVKRMKLWNFLVANGLDRVLYGVESGVDTILERFNKKTTKLQNENAIRILSASSIPVRLTYITFDPLMSMEELLESFEFQGRKDLILNPLKEMPEDELFDGVHSTDFIEKHSANRRLYQEISYLLVSMECLIGSKYLSKVDEAGLAREFNYSMGKRNADYLDKRIGLMSYNSQLWVDRNFSLDYTIKSVEKIAPKEKRKEIRELRNVVKDFAYGLLSQFLAIVTKNYSLVPPDLVPDISHLRDIEKNFDYSMNNMEHNQKLFEKIMDVQFDNLCNFFTDRYNEVRVTFSEKDKLKMDCIINEWQGKSQWRLINAA